MHRPETDKYERKLAGMHGMAVARTMEHVGVRQLLDYIKALEKNQCKCSKDK